MQGIFDELKKLKKGALVKVMWLDACTVKDADTARIPLPNSYVETRRTTVGEFVCLQQGKAQGAWHLILEMDNMEDNGSTIRSLPVCLIYKIIVHGKYAESAQKISKHKDYGNKFQKLAVRKLLHLRKGELKVID